MPDSLSRKSTNEAVQLELYTPLDDVDLRLRQSHVRFRRDRIPLNTSGTFAWGAVSGIHAGNIKQVGAFYHLVYQQGPGALRHHLDPMASSLPSGAFAPAELFDLGGLLARRKDGAYFDQIQAVADADGVPRVRGPVNILQIHVHTASEEGIFAGLTALYHQIAQKLRQGPPLSAAEQSFIGYDAVQLMPIEPVIEYEDGPPFWQTIRESDDEIEVQMRRPDMTNWGYDVVIAGSPAINPTTLATGGPDDFLEFIEVLHTFPGKPIKVVLDVVYGHADNQALQILDDPGARLFDYGLMPGIPMDFINANMRSPWSFVRNTDVRFAVKVVSEEARFLAWAVTENDFRQHFRRLRRLGFADLGALQRFIDALAHYVSATANDLEQVTHLMCRLEPPLSGPSLSPESLVAFARDWMDDVPVYFNIWRHTSRLDARQTSFDMELREFRRQRPWLVENFRSRDQFD